MEESQHNEIESGDKVKKDFTGLIGSIRVFLVELLDIRENTDRETTIRSIQEDIPFKGHTAWILVCSIFIASIGLNANSTPVVIGAMLISPLMGPILGMGLSLAINDVDSLKRSLNNFGVMVGLSVLTAFLFFTVFPLKADSSELLARTKPDIRDVLIAFFGGMALVIARAKKGTVASVIFGVAIATALMPPLCTVGYGLAMWKPEFFLGASYLFVINTIFIGLATYMILKVLKFPMVKYANSKKRMRTMQIASVVALVVMAPAIYTFYNVIQETAFTIQANKFIDEHVKVMKFKDGDFMEKYSEVNYNDGKNPTIELAFSGQLNIPDEIKQNWNIQKDNYNRLKGAVITYPGAAKENMIAKERDYLSKLNEANAEQLKTKEEELQFLRNEVIRLNAVAGKQIPFEDVSKELKANYPAIATVVYSDAVTTNFAKIDTTLAFTISWLDSVKVAKPDEELKKIKSFIHLRLKDTTIVVKDARR